MINKRLIELGVTDIAIESLLYHWKRILEKMVSMYEFPSITFFPDQDIYFEDLWLEWVTQN